MSAAGVTAPAVPDAPLHAAERAWLAALTLVWAIGPWWLGSTQRPAVQLALGLALLALGLAWWVRRRHGGAPRWSATGRIAVLAATAFAVLVLAQSLRVGGTFTPGWPVGHVTPVDTAWPSSLDVAGAWIPRQALPLHSSTQRLEEVALLLTLGLAWVVGAVRPRLVRRTWEVLVILAVLVAGYAFGHGLTGGELTLGFYTDGFHHVRGAHFPYRNQQVAYLLLSLAGVLAALLARGPAAPWGVGRVRRWWLGLATLLVAAGAVSTTSRAGLAGTVALLGAAAVVQRARYVRAGGRPARWLLATVAGAVALGGLAAALEPVRQAAARFGNPLTAEHRFLLATGHRALVQQIGWEMFLDRPVFGWGAGSFLPLFEDYHPRVPAYARTVLARQPGLQRLYWMHPDGDWIEFLVEHGVLGVGLILTPLGVWVVVLWRRRAVLSGAVVLLAIGVAGVVLHGTLDYVLRNPAVAGLLLTQALLTARLLQPDCLAGPRPVRERPGR